MPSAQPLLAQSFEIVEATLDDIHAAYRAGILTARQLVQMSGPRQCHCDEGWRAVRRKRT